jgi:hypothetical protein
MQENQDIYQVRRKRILLLIIVALLLPIGLLIKVYGNELFSNKFTDLLYVVFWSFVAAMLFPNKKPMMLVVLVSLITCLLEILQLSSNPFLEAIRSTFLGRTLIGNTFDWTDFIYYILGAVLSYFLLKKIHDNFILEEVPD